MVLSTLTVLCDPATVELQNLFISPKGYMYLLSSSSLFPFLPAPGNH